MYTHHALFSRLLFSLVVNIHTSSYTDVIIWIVFKVAVQTYRALHDDAPQCLRHAVHISRRHPDPTKTSVLHFGRSVCSCCQTAYCWTSCFLCCLRACLERSSCRRHFSTFSVHFPKTFKTASVFTFVSWQAGLVY